MAREWGHNPGDELRGVGGTDEKLDEDHPADLPRRHRTNPGGRPRRHSREAKDGGGAGVKPFDDWLADLEDIEALADAEDDAGPLGGTA